MISERFSTFTINDDNQTIWGDEAIFFNNEPVGYVTSGGWGPVTEKNIALGYILPECYAENNSFLIEIKGKMIPAQLSIQSLYDPKGLRMYS